MHRELTVLQPQLQVKFSETQELVGVVSQEQQEAEVMKRVIMLEEARVREIREESRALVRQMQRRGMRAYVAGRAEGGVRS